MEYTPLDLLTGPETYERLVDDAREAFDAEWDAALAAAERDFDAEALVLLVCRWWLVSGGDPLRADFTRAEWSRMCEAAGTREGSLAPRCPRTAAGLLDVLDLDERVELAEAWVAACRAAVAPRDWHGLWEVVTEAYDAAHVTRPGGRGAVRGRAGTVVNARVVEFAGPDEYGVFGGERKVG
ncbi:hypothetical protein AB0I28_23165 [Phytomonospora sp. NPDC050363]|uniref:hypothetical protein n=1 Tax=Phytomonospora sp. NPDC050363 TaxID=3155642 RepID=UPI0033F6B874